MKKTYQKPSTEMVQTRTSTFVCNSKSIWSDEGIGYGGVDNDGKVTPSARFRNKLWDDEE